MRVLHKWKERIDRLTFHPAGGHLATAYRYGRLAVWDVAGDPSRPAWTDDPAGAPTGLCYSPDGRWLVYGGVYLHGRAYDLSDPKPTPRPWSEDHTLCHALAPDGRTLVVSLPVRSADRLVAMPWPPAHPGATAWSVPRETDSYFAELVGLPPGDRFLAVNRHRSRVDWFELRDFATGQLMAETPAVTTLTAPAAVSPDGALVAAPAGKNVFVWQVSRLWLPFAKLTNDGRLHFTRVAFHPSGRYLAATGNDGTVKLYDTASWQVVRTFTWNVGRLRSVAFSPDGLLAAAGSDTGRIIVWDVDI